jgi:hypothetical protein
MKTAPVDGKVTFQGQPVKGGSITFRPIKTASTKESLKGKPASGSVKDDGTFVLTTYGKDDGAVIGTHEVLFIPFTVGAKDYDDKPAPSPYAGCVPKTKEVEVKAGKNHIEIELVPGPGAAPAAPETPATPAKT